MKRDPRKDPSVPKIRGCLDAVSDTLVPHTISADLESLSGRSTRSSNGPSRSHKSSNSEGMATVTFLLRSGMPLGGSVASDIVRLEIQLRSLGKHTQ
eukprot:scaffold137184_cov45-Attheya_sp.AAC.2